MRSLLLHNQWIQAHATLSQLLNTEIVSSVWGPEKEYHFIRDAVGLTDFSHVHTFKVPENQGVDFLDSLLAGNVAKVRFGRVLHTLLADDNGYLLADCYVANNDEELVLLCESIIDAASLWDLFEKHGAKEAGISELSGSHVALSIDGAKAWAVTKELFGTDVLGLPYLSIERYTFEGETVRLLRAGKTSEFGYLVLAPHACAEAFFAKVSTIVGKHGGGLCGLTIHNDLRLEGRFFNIFAEGKAVRDPLSLGLQWMVDFDKETFMGRDAIMARRSAGLTHKIIGIQREPGTGDMSPGTPVFDGSEKVSEIVASCFSYQLNSYVGLALFPVSVAYSGLSFRLKSPDGPLVKTISMPPIMPKSLSVKLDEM